ncbi:bifunctional ornithine acetyltransferase/N-acetylglutamate synthase [Acetobacterium woodii]|uniref:Arginine biosynthesis bifunctional protein ArgJ n=1 Tax=Acetobacterium woodii (strain ATCC 29683 / DSM 1030 / JCM 2381 / KCTC 1655 / WB1) TaxID=931626 RepID=H6LEN7_ACEWD|nr:bifunctional ornithine acetyltransferase/N-acetylglutamate synthase [Acetobacterium woodii]AFA48140.1 arginine biosynthesis bifunctional protein ArgJ [Acetobacterium woodii DSM 1030]
MKVIKTGGVITPAGFKSGGLSSGVKMNGKKDLAIIYSEVPGVTSIMTTTNVVKAAPILWCNKVIANPYKQAVVVNSGNANACTGKKGAEDVEKTANQVASVLGLKPEDVLVASTGVIGLPLPVEKILAGIETLGPQLGNSIDDGEAAATAILTTDTDPKTVAVEVQIQGKAIKIGGMAKGSGMIHPNMATMLSFVTTDVNIEPAVLNKLLKETTIDTYNMISVDGDTSTNDMVTVIANGLAGNDLLVENTPDFEIFKEAFIYVHKTLAKKIIRDGEGATKFVEVNVFGAETKAAARTLAKSVVTSSLVKTALFGEDANWGRVLCALGYAGVNFDPLKVSLVFSSQAGMVTLLNDGVPIAFDEEEAKKVLSETDIMISVEMKEGDEKAVAWGCDLSYDYVKINGDYRS